VWQMPKQLSKPSRNSAAKDALTRHCRPR
jgi:hypothetical protein